MKRTDAKLLAADIVECALFVALMTAAANISIPFFPVPLTFQTVISVLAGLLLGRKKGAVSTSVYCLAGLAGIPVFANLGGGIAYIFKPTFGYILGFILSAYVAGFIVRKDGAPFWRYAVASLAAVAAGYAVGVPYFAIIWRFYLNSPSLWQNIIEFNLLYIPKDLILSILAAAIAVRITSRIRRRRETAKPSVVNKR